MKYLISALIGALFAICAVEAQRRPPNYSLDEMPRTSFSCRDKIVGGYYADPETDCQMFHVCVRVAGLGVQDFRFLCPNDTSFDQENQICDDWYNIDCEASTLFYSDNFDLYRLSDGVPEFGPSRATPISLGPSSAPPVYSAKPKRPHLPVNNAVGEDDDDTYLQKADTGDRRLHKDLLRGSSSGNFFANRNNGKEDNDDDETSASADFSKNKFGDAQAKKKSGKVAVRKLLTGKRPVQQQQVEQTSVAPTTPVSSTTVANVQNNNFGAVRQRYNTVQRNRVTTPAPYVETSTTYNNNNNFNNNYNNNNYNSRNNFNNYQTPTTAAPTSSVAYNNNNFNSRNNYNNYQTPTTAAPASSVAYNNNFRSRGNVNFNTYNQETGNNYQETSSTTQATTANNNNFNRNYNQNYNNNNNNNYNNYQYQTSTANPFNYNYQSTNVNGAQQQTSTKFYNTQQQNTQQQSSTTSNYYQTQQQSTKNNNNYYQQQQNYNNFNNNNYNAQTSSVASSAAYQQPTTYRTTSFNNNYNGNYNNGNNNYNQQQSTTFNYDNYYQTSTVAPRAFEKSTTYNYYTTTVAPQPSGFQNYYEKSSTNQAVNNNYQAKNTNYNFNVKASVGGSNNYNPYNAYNGNDKYEEPTHGESLKTAPSSNIRPSDLNALAYNKEAKKNVGFNATVGTSYNFDKTSAQTKKVNPYTVAVPTAKTVTNPPATVTTTTVRPQQQQYQQHQNTAQQHQNGQHQNNNAQQNAQKVDNKSTAAPVAQSAAKDNSYDYAYYDDASPSEYDGFEPAGEDFARTAARG